MHFLPFRLPPRDLDETLLVHPSSPWRMENNRGWKSRWRCANTCTHESESKKRLHDGVCLFCTELDLQQKRSIDSCFWIKTSPDLEDLQCNCLHIWAHCRSLSRQLRGLKNDLAIAVAKSSNFFLTFRTTDQPSRSWPGSQSRPSEPLKDAAVKKQKRHRSVCY